MKEKIIVAIIIVLIFAGCLAVGLWFMKTVITSDMPDWLKFVFLLR